MANVTAALTAVNASHLLRVIRRAQEFNATSDSLRANDVLLQQLCQDSQLSCVPAHTVVPTASIGALG